MFGEKNAYEKVSLIDINFNNKINIYTTQTSEQQRRIDKYTNIDCEYTLTFQLHLIKL